MLTCVHHPIDPMRVVEEDEAQKLKESGVWFDCPAKAKRYREKVEEDIKRESKVAKQKVEQSKTKLKEQLNER